MNRVKVAVTSLKLKIRLQAYLVGTNTRSGTKAIFYAHLIGSCIQNWATLHIGLFQAETTAQRL